MSLPSHWLADGPAGATRTQAGAARNARVPLTGWLGPRSASEACGAPGGRGLAGGERAGRDATVRDGVDLQTRLSARRGGRFINKGRTITAAARSGGQARGGGVGHCRPLPC